MTRFIRLNHSWNAAPNGLEPRIEWRDDALVLRFSMNAVQFSGFEENDIGELLFIDCACYRLGRLNYDAWYRGESRWPARTHAWGEFYRIGGGQAPGPEASDWHTRETASGTRQHYLFYLPENDFECEARDWRLQVIRGGDAEHCSNPSLAKERATREQANRSSRP